MLHKKMGSHEGVVFQLEYTQDTWLYSYWVKKVHKWCNISHPAFVREDRTKLNKDTKLTWVTDAKSMSDCRCGCISNINRYLIYKENL